MNIIVSLESFGYFILIISNIASISFLVSGIKRKDNDEYTTGISGLIVIWLCFIIIAIDHYKWIVFT